jgi:hypothetical protein
VLYIRYSILSNSVATFEFSLVYFYFTSINHIIHDIGQDVFNIFHIHVREIKEENPYLYVAQPPLIRSDKNKISSARNKFLNYVLKYIHNTVNFKFWLYLFKHHA